MLRQDYVLREIERMVEFCLRATGLKKADTMEEFEQFLEEHCETLTGLPLSTLVDIDAQKLVALLYHPGTAKLPQLVSCGAWLCEAAEISLHAGRQQEAQRLYLRGAQILAFLRQQHGQEKEFAPLTPHLERLQERLDTFVFAEPLHSQVTALLAPSADRT